MSLIAGVDEAGRGCLAGPVVAAAVILPDGFSHPLLKDSKALLPYQREAIYRALIEAGALIGIGMQGPHVIDQVNILQATLLAMQEAVETLPVSPLFTLIDGLYTPAGLSNAQAYPKADQRFPVVAAASIVAKVVRDQLMQRLHREYPFYGWATNKGYPTPAHRKAIALYGPSPLHRVSFL